MALIQPRFINATVAIGTLDKDDKEKWVGSGFLYSSALPVSGPSHIYVVSNKHVFESLENIIIRFNPVGRTEPLDIFANVKDGSTILHLHQDFDLGAFHLQISFEAAGITGDHCFDEGDILTRHQVKETGITEGDFTYLLGFPASIIDDGGKGYVVVRHGSIARIRGYIESREENILIDTMNYPGNSGGPVINKPDAIYIQNTPSVTNSYLLGVVSSYIIYEDLAISQQTGKARISFQENSGLANIVPAHILKEWIDTIPVAPLLQPAQ